MVLFMRPLLFAMTAFILAISACSKSNDINILEKGNGCIEKLTIPVTSHGTLSDSEYTLIDLLFITNGISNSHYRYTRTYRDSEQVYNGIYDYRHVPIIQYTNGLPIFIESLNYAFKNGMFDSYAGRITGGTNLNSTPILTLGQLRKLFIDDIELFDYKGSQFKDSCINAEFGYFNLNVGTENNSENLVKAWHLTPKFSSYPEAYYGDIEGQRIYYSNGIVTFK
jgi:hypothetical protein